MRHDACWRKRERQTRYLKRHVARATGTGFLVFGYRPEASRRSANARTVLTHLTPTRAGRADDVM
ncbi:hypothetical protein WL28_23365 [Burkholderia ubonensis]|nr:hypothetical protein WJ77_04475 [Burkholderia ubonensis]KVO81515.1 hypothetical protein WJ79_02445 [Burkholderia ubonensis]KVP38712.1 hypothetical protein WJ89_22895 [Burkholderia ubonensis]KVQ71333.1 hypothetical protein WK06_28945 [Burkholderia ubonensis]KVQ95065.1 hypothetical protein WK09_08850 [Burkholderia ubonensis]